MSTKKAILILGMHRSGTSALAGVISRLGAYFGNNIMPSSSENKKGYYENMDIFTLNKYILYKLNSTWHDTNELIMDSENKELLAELSILIEYVLKTSFGFIQGIGSGKDSSIIAIKDPRICLFLPLYKKVLNEMNYEVHLIKAYRDESEIVASLMSRDKGFTENKCRDLVSKYNRAIENIIEDIPIINYSNLLNNTDTVLSCLKQHLWFLDYSDTNISLAKEFLDASLKHH